MLSVTMPATVGRVLPLAFVFPAPDSTNVPPEETLQAPPHPELYVRLASPNARETVDKVNTPAHVPAA